MPSLLNLRYSLRSLKNNKFSLFINVFGFAMSLAFVIMIGLYVQKEYSVDGFQKDKERIFRVEKDGSEFRPGHPSHFIDDLRSRFPQIEKGLKMLSSNTIVTIADANRLNVDILFTDKEFFDIFTLDFKEGNAAAALASMTDVVLSESFARTHFGDTPVVGKTIKIGDDTFNVSAVIKDIKNSHLCAVPMIVRSDYAIKKTPFLAHPGNSAWSLYIKIISEVNIDSFEAELSKCAKERFAWRKDPLFEVVNLKPIGDIYLTPHSTRDLAIFRYLRCNDPKFIATMLATAVLILIFACINYLNLSVAQSGFRAKSTAIQRLLGSSERVVFWGFIAESIGVLLISGVIATVMAWLAFPWFGKLMSMQMSFADEFSWLNTLTIAAVVFVMGTVSGWAPAAVISGFKPIEVTRGTFRRKTKTVYSKILITFQYTITIVLLGCAAVIIQQIKFMRNSDLGFDTENLIVCDYNLQGDATPLVNNIKNIPGVVNAVQCAFYPMSNKNNNLTFHDNDDVQHSFSIYNADSTFISILGLKIKSENSRNPNGHWINETTARLLGIDENDVEYTNAEYKFPIRGILYDFHFMDFTTSIGELEIRPLEDWATHLVVKISGANRTETFRRVRETYNDMAGGDLFNGQFMEEQIAYFYKDQHRLSNLLMLLSFVAIVISSMGMLAMSIYFTRQRARDMAVRKVFGATPQGVLRLLMGGFLKLVGVAFVIAVPIIYFLMQDWLSGYVYRIKLTPVPFLIAGGIVLIMAVLTVVGHSMKVALSNPVDSLKAE